MVDRVLIDEDHHVRFLLNNKYRDYIEDYGTQDEVMFVSEKGDGKFWIIVPEAGAGPLEEPEHFPAEKKLFLGYGIFTAVANNYPVLIT